MNELTPLLREAAAGRISRRRLLSLAASMGVSSGALAQLAYSPTVVNAQRAVRWARPPTN
ncbi:MAG: hypothetical protein R2839_04685 [Thermomicrobiales bacterium]